MRSAVGVYLSNGSVRVAHVAGSVSRPRLKAIVEERWDGAEPSLPELLARNRIPRKPSAVVLPAELVTVRKTSLPLTNLTRIQRTIRFHAERLIPGISPDEIALDFFITRREKDATELILLVVKRADLAAHLESLQLGDGRPDVITVDFVATFNLLSQARAFQGASRAAAVGFSGTVITMLLVRDGAIDSIRTLPLHGRTALPERLARELDYSRTAAGIREPLDRVILAGEVPADLETDGLAERIGCEVTRPDAPSRLRGRLKGEAAHRAVVPAGGALANLGRTALPVNLRLVDAAHRTSYEVVRKPILLAAVMLLALIAAELLSTMQARTRAVGHLSRLVSDARYWYGRVVTGKRPAFDSSFHKTIEAIAKRRSGAGAGEANWLSFIDFLRVLCEHLPSGYQTVIQTISFRGEKATIRGEAQDVSSFEELARSLEKSGRFEVRTPFRMRSGRRSGPERLAFTIELSPRSQ